METIDTFDESSLADELDSASLEREGNVRFLQMSAEVQLDSMLSPTDKAVYATLCCFISGVFRDERVCFPSVARIAKYTNCSERTVYRSINALLKRGAIKVIKTRQKDGRRGRNNYILMNKLPEIQTAKNDEPENQTANLSKPDCQKRQYVSITTNLDKDTLPTVEGAGAPEACAGLSQPVGVPRALIETVKLLLMQTDRNMSSLTGEEFTALTLLEKKHVPSRIQREISIAVERFNRQKRPLSELSFCYIWECLKNQNSKKAAFTKGKQPAPVTSFGLSPEEEEEQQRDIEKYRRRE